MASSAQREGAGAARQGGPHRRLRAVLTDTCPLVRPGPMKKPRRRASCRTRHATLVNFTHRLRWMCSWHSGTQFVPVPEQRRDRLDAACCGPPRSLARRMSAQRGMRSEERCSRLVPMRWCSHAALAQAAADRWLPGAPRARPGIPVRPDAAQRTVGTSELAASGTSATGGPGAMTMRMTAAVPPDHPTFGQPNRAPSTSAPPTRFRAWKVTIALRARVYGSLRISSPTRSKIRYAAFQSPNATAPFVRRLPPAVTMSGHLDHRPAQQRRRAARAASCRPRVHARAQPSGPCGPRRSSRAASTRCRWRRSGSGPRGRGR